MKVTGNKIVYDSNQGWQFKDDDGKMVASYFPNTNIDDKMLWDNLIKLPFTRVFYISQYGKANRTPRYTWAFGQIGINIPNPEYKGTPEDLFTTLRSIQNPDAVKNREMVSYRGLDFLTEPMPDWLELLSQYCRRISIMNWGFDPEYNSCIIGMYNDGEDQIGFHTDDQSFLTHNLCANVTLGYSRDFQFKIVDKNGNKQTYEISLGHKSIFFFIGLEHALPARKTIKEGSIRFSISFRNMKNNIGIGNSFYYCRGLVGAVDNERKKEYETKLKLLQENK